MNQAAIYELYADELFDKLQYELAAHNSLNGYSNLYAKLGEDENKHANILFSLIKKNVSTRGPVEDSVQSERPIDTTDDLKTETTSKTEVEYPKVDELIDNDTISINAYISGIKLLPVPDYRVYIRDPAIYVNENANVQFIRNEKQSADKYLELAKNYAKLAETNSKEKEYHLYMRDLFCRLANEEIMHIELLTKYIYEVNLYNPPFRVICTNRRCNSNEDNSIVMFEGQVIGKIPEGIKYKYS